jgi:hypothetical protein
MGVLSRSFALVLSLGGIVISAGLARTWQVQRSSKQQQFLGGRVPPEMPNGFYEGSADFYTGSWKGKIFDAAQGRGINVLESNGRRHERFSFRIYVGAGLKDPQIEVLKIDYDLPENPRWLRRLPFSLGYFRLESTAVRVPAQSSARQIVEAVPGDI